MSTKYTGGFITKSPVAPTTSAASGIWTLDQQQQAQKAGTWPSPPIFIEDLFSTYLYTGTGATQTITNNIDLSGQGGLVWSKNRTQVDNNRLYDTARGTNNVLFSNSTSAALTDSNTVTAFNNNGYSIGTSGNVNFNGDNFVSWTFRKQPKFFDVVTWSGNGTTQAISHNLGSVPGFIIVKKTNSAEDWWCFHRYDFTYRTKLNATSAAVNTTSVKYLGNNVVDVTPTSTSFTIGDTGGLNGSGDTFVAYLFAHDAGGFPVSGGGSTNGISCGSYTGTGSTLSVTLGYEPQWVMIKRTDTTADWQVIDNMRGWTADGVCQRLVPNTSAAEAGPTGSAFLFPTATGFGSAGSSAIVNSSGGTYIYIAIRRGPMKTPTVGTSVFSPIVATNSQGTENTTGFPLDMQIANIRSGYASNGVVPSRLTGVSSNTTSSGSYLRTPSTNAEATGSDITQYWGNTGFQTSSNWAGSGMVYWNFRRAPSFFDEVCYTGTGSAMTVTHNLGVVPELIIVKRRDSTSEWKVYTTATGNGNELVLNSSGAVSATDAWNDTSPTASVFSIGSPIEISSATYVAYLFATCAGVSKVGSYTGTGTTLQIDCGFTGGARFVLIKRSDNSGSPQNWYVWDSARGIVSGNDPYLLLNSTAAEVTNTDYVDTYSAGFEISSTAPADINANGGTFIFLAIA